MESKFEKSVVAQGGSTIKNVANDGGKLILNKTKKTYWFFGFIIGIITSIIGTYIYEHFIK